MIENTTIVQGFPEGQELKVLLPGLLRKDFRMRLRSKKILVAIHTVRDRRYLIGAVRLNKQGEPNKPWVVPPYDGQGIEQRLTAEAKRLRREKLRAHRSPTVSASPQATSGPRLQRKGLPGRPSPTVPTSHHAASPHLRQNAPPGRRSRLTISTPA